MVCMRVAALRWGSVLLIGSAAMRLCRPAFRIPASPSPRGRGFAILRHSSGAGGVFCAGTSGESQRCRRVAGSIPVIPCSRFPQGWKSIRNAEPSE